jgi:carbon storage regulator
VIGENVELVVLALNGGRVTLGFTAPSNVPIHREEVHRRVQSEDGRMDVKTCDAKSLPER